MVWPIILDDGKKYERLTLDEAVELADIGMRLTSEMWSILRNDINPERLDELFQDMSKDKYKPVFERILQKRYPSQVWMIKDVLKDYMESYGFEVPTKSVEAKVE